MTFAFSLKKPNELLVSRSSHDDITPRKTF